MCCFFQWLCWEEYYFSYLLWRVCLIMTENVSHNNSKTVMNYSTYQHTIHKGSYEAESWFINDLLQFVVTNDVLYCVLFISICRFCTLGKHYWASVVCSVTVRSLCNISSHCEIWLRSSAQYYVVQLNLTGGTNLRLRFP